VALPSRWLSVGVLALTAALAVAGCTSGQAPASPASSKAAGGASSSTPPALTTAQASQAFDRYVTTVATADRTDDGTLALSVVTGAQRSLVAAEMKQAGYAHRPVAFDPYSYGTPTFYLPEAGGYPRFFVASAARHYPGSDSSPASAGVEMTWAGSAEVPLNGTALLLFEQSSAGSSWQLASTSVLEPGASTPQLASDADGAVPTVPLDATTLLAQPDITGPLQAGVVDDGPASAASKAVAAGRLTTGMYQAAADHVQGLTPPAGDVYQWDLEGSDYTAFTFRTADGAALVFYSMYLETVTATPGFIDKASPVEPGPRIGYPDALAAWIGTGPHRDSVQVQDLLSFAAVDPPAGHGKIQVIAVGGGVNYATAS
jgi:hypothetical protein